MTIFLMCFYLATSVFYAGAALKFYQPSLWLSVVIAATMLVTLPVVW